MARLTHLECTRCGQSLPGDRPQTICPKDGGVLYARYDFPTIKKTFSREQLCGRPATMWRYAEVLPEAQPVRSAKVSLPCCRAGNIQRFSSKTKG